jgi:TolA-binding protein
MKILILIFLSGLMIGACSPVRTTTMSKVQKNNSTETDKNSREDSDYDYSSRFRDTTYLALQDVKIESKARLTEMFSATVNKFKNGNYDESCIEFSVYASTLAPGDSLLYEALFYDCECKILKNQLIDAKIILTELLDDELITSRIEQKSLVRLGQIECVSGNEAKAEEYFKLLKLKYPDSKYIKLANCDAVK